jgi:hypothetical protein
MRILDSTTVIITDTSHAVARPVKELPKVIPVNQIPAVTKIEKPVTVTVKDSAINSTSKKDSVNTYFHEPWKNILSINNHIATQNIKRDKIFSDNNVEVGSKGTNKIIHTEELLFPASTLVLSSLLLVLLIFSLAKVTYGKYMRQFMNAIVNYSEANKLYDDRNIMIDRLFLVMNFVFIISGGLFLNFLISIIDPGLTNIHPYITLLTCFSVIKALYFYKFFFGKILGFILLKVQVFNEYLYSSFLYYKVIGIFLLPICLLLYIVPNEYKFDIIIFGLIIISLALILSIFRATRIIL